MDFDSHDAVPGALAVADPNHPRGWRWEVPADLPVQSKGELYGFGDEPQAVPYGADTQVLTVDHTAPTGIRWLHLPVTFPVYTGRPSDAVEAQSEVGYLRTPFGFRRECLFLTLLVPSSQDILLCVRSGMTTEEIVIAANTVVHRHEQILVLPAEGLVVVDVVQAAGDARGLNVMLLGHRCPTTNSRG